MIKLGLDAKTFRGTAGATAATEMKNIKDLTLSLESGEADITTRRTAGWRVSKATLKEASIEWQMVYDTEDADFVAIKSAYLSGEPLSLFVSDGDGSGLDCDVSIISFSMEQPLEDAISISVTAKPTDAGRAPVWVDGGSSEG